MSEIERLAEAMWRDIAGWDKRFDGYDTIGRNAVISLLTAQLYEGIERE